MASNAPVFIAVAAFAFKTFPAAEPPTAAPAPAEAPTITPPAADLSSSALSSATFLAAISSITFTSQPSN